MGFCLLSVVNRSVTECLYQGPGKGVHGAVGSSHHTLVVTDFAIKILHICRDPRRNPGVSRSQDGKRFKDELMIVFDFLCITCPDNWRPFRFVALECQLGGVEIDPNKLGMACGDSVEKLV